MVVVFVGIVFYLIFDFLDQCGCPAFSGASFFIAGEVEENFALKFVLFGPREHKSSFSGFLVVEVEMSSTMFCILKFSSIDFSAMGCLRGYCDNIWVDGHAKRKTRSCDKNEYMIRGCFDYIVKLRLVHDYKVI